MQRHMIVVRAQWDAQAEVWVATSADLPGLVTVGIEKAAGSMQPY